MENYQTAVNGSDRAYSILGTSVGDTPPEIIPADYPRTDHTFILTLNYAYSREEIIDYIKKLPYVYVNVLNTKKRAYWTGVVMTALRYRLTETEWGVAETQKAVEYDEIMFEIPRESFMNCYYFGPKDLNMLQRRNDTTNGTPIAWSFYNWWSTNHLAFSNSNADLTGLGLKDLAPLDGVNTIARILRYWIAVRYVNGIDF